MKVISIIIVAVLLAGCEVQVHESTPDKITVHKTFVHPDSLELGIEPFLILAVEKKSRDKVVLQYLDKAGIDYELYKNEQEFVPGLGGLNYKWYDVYANNKNYVIGFCNSRLFSYREDSYK
jgi:hypothetical protein